MAITHLARIRSHGLLTDGEFAGFSDATREWVNGLLKIWNAAEQRTQSRKKRRRE